jgi:hypothetical protein
MAIKYLTITLFFAVTIIKPVHDAYPDKEDKKPHNATDEAKPEFHTVNHGTFSFLKEPTLGVEPDYLWMYLAFAYFFTALALYLIIVESRRIIDIRQDYLGSQSTITDRTIRLSGIPHYLHDEAQIKDFIEDLEIGKVESVTLCRDWKELDDAMKQRGVVLRKLERAMVEHLHRLREQRHFESLPTTAVASPTSETSSENARLLEDANGSRHSHDSRPKTRLWYGRLKLQHRTVDAIDYYEEKLRRLDEDIQSMRKKEFPTKPLAFVTMDSVAACVRNISPAFNIYPPPSIYIYPRSLVFGADLGFFLANGSAGCLGLFAIAADCHA